MISITEPTLEEISANEAKFLSTFNQAAVGIAHVSLTGRLMRVNHKLCEFFGYSKAELLDMGFQELTYPQDLQKDLQQMHRVLSGQIDTYSLEKRYIRKDGRIVWAELTVSLVRVSRETQYFISVVADIDDRKRAEEALLQAHLELARERQTVQREYDNFFDLSRDILAISSVNGTYLRVNPAFCELLGYTSAELTSQPMLNFVHPDDRERLSEFREHLRNRPNLKFDHYENRLVARDGSIKWISWTGRVVPGVGNYISGRDITDRKVEEAAAKQRQILMTTNLKLNAIGQMAANMAHEINNPLTIIYGEACMLKKMVEQKDSDASKLSRIAGNVVKMSERIVAIVNGLRALARDGSSDPMKSVPLAQIFEETIPFCRGKISAANIDLAVEPIDTDIYVCCRSVQLSQALLNLMNNAYDAVVNVERARIEVFTQKTKSRVEICVRDNGPGVPEEIRRNLFQPFISNKEVGKGMGLGLSVSKDMIEANGGELFLAAASPQTTFVISLPRVDCE